MYRVTKRLEIAGSHCLKLPYESKCKNIHGHNWIVSVEVSGERLNTEGMLIDFGKIKEIVNVLDHNHVNDLVNFNPTAENLSEWIAQKINTYLGETWNWSMDRPYVSQVIVQESEENTACYIPDIL